MSDEIVVNEGQRFALNKLVGTVADTDRDMRLYIIGQMIGREISSSAQVTENEWRIICRQAYPFRFQDDWTVEVKFTAAMVHYAKQYREKVLGQRRLF